jgi:signal peptidase I
LAIEEQHALQTPERKETLLESVSGMAYVLVIGLFVLTFVAQNFEIPSPSMMSTLLVGDHLLVDHSTLTPPAKWMPFMHSRAVQRGDIIVFLKPNPEEPDLILVKRAVGLPGDHIRVSHGILYRNGVAQKEPQISLPDGSDAEHAYSPYRDDFPTVLPADDFRVTATWANEIGSHIQNGELVVPPDKIFAMGDNRIGSLDSRFWGFVPMKAVLGRPLFVYWSFMTPADQMYKKTANERIAFFVHQVVHFFDETRWKRMFHRVQ